MTETHLAQSSERIETQLTPNQRWLLSQRSIRGISSDDEQFESLVANLPDQQPNPEAQAILNERKRRLARAVADLSDQDRLLIRLRFEEGLTLEQPARLLGLANAQRADSTNQRDPVEAEGRDGIEVVFSAPSASRFVSVPFLTQRTQRRRERRVGKKSASGKKQTLSVQ